MTSAFKLDMNGADIDIINSASDYEINLLVDET